MTRKIIHVNTLAEIADRQPTYLALGSFDGVHRGHQTILRSMVDAAQDSGVRTVVITFFPHPKRVIQDLPGRYYINSLEERLALLSARNVDMVIAHPFNDQTRNIRAAAFVDQLRDWLDMRQIWGGNFAFGYNREGNQQFLKTVGPEKGFSVQLVESMESWDGQLVSSSRIRKSLAVGRIEDVNGCLGRTYTITGTVVKGDQRGRTIGFPTANLAVWDELLLPANGVYATFVSVGDKRYMAATNVGVRPTVNGRQRLVEAHLLNFDDDIYGQSIKVEFISHIRPEQKFSGIPALKTQINADVLEVIRQLESKSIE
jgi:riboflavin kinase/FMN adenylyltransferase